MKDDLETVSNKCLKTECLKIVLPYKGNFKKQAT